MDLTNDTQTKAQAVLLVGSGSEIAKIALYKAFYVSEYMITIC